MRLNNGYGDVIPNSLQVIKKNVSNSKLTALLHSNNRDTWVLSQTYSSNSNDSIVANLVTPTGIMPAVITPIPKQLGTNGRMKASPNSEMFALGSRGSAGTQNGLEIFDFNRSTGVSSLKYSLPDQDLTYIMSSFAFSPDNTKLYAGTAALFGAARKAILYQYNLAAGNAAQIQQSRNVIYQTTDYYTVFDIQLAIDGKLYLIIDRHFFINGYYYPNNQYLAKINCPNYYGAACRFQLQGIGLKQVNPGAALPSLNQTLFRNANKLQAQAVRNIICEGDSVQLSAYGAGAEQFRWQLANGLAAPSDTLADPFVNPTITTTYRVIGMSTCNTDTAYVKITVLPRPASIAATGPVKVHTFAEKQVYIVQPSVTGSKFTWQVTGGNITAGQGSNSVQINWGTAGAGTISVAEINAGGCPGERKNLAVEISGEPLPIFYNVITPNNDNRNDAFVIGNLNWYPENELKIYNRWGQEVYQNSNYQNNWQAEKLSAGVYYYFFTANGKSWKGWVEVMR